MAEQALLLDELVANLVDADSAVASMFRKQPEDGAGHTGLLPGHCHQKALAGMEPTRAALRAGGYGGGLGGGNCRLMNLSKSEEPQQRRRFLERMASGNFGCDKQTRRRDNRTREQFQARREFDERYHEQLAAMLTPGQVQRLPEIQEQRRGDQRWRGFGEGRGRRGGRGGDEGSGAHGG